MPTPEEIGRLLDEQAALRRVATLVARGADRLGVFAAVTEEVGRLLGADLANMIRFEGNRGTIVGGWSGGLAPEAPVGFEISLTGDSIAARIRRSGRPARLDSYEHPGETFAALRELGLKASVGAPVIVDGELWGAVLAGTTVGGAFPAGAEERLGGFAELVAQALANAEAREQLSASRKRLVEAGQTERRRLERNLHDGAQQRLVAVSLALRVAERQLDHDPAAARETLARAGHDLAEALAELRELARGLHPAVLTDRGLGPALTALASRAPLPVDVEVALDQRPPEPVEAAAYFLVSEALTNVARYAFARSATVRVAQDGERIRVEVTDDGDGGADPAKGSGLRGLADRVEALGGRFSLLSTVGRGTTVRAELPAH